MGTQSSFPTDDLSTDAFCKCPCDRRALPVVRPEQAEIECEARPKGTQPAKCAGYTCGCQPVDESNAGTAERKFERNRCPEHLDPAPWCNFLAVEKCI